MKVTQKWIIFTIFLNLQMNLSASSSQKPNIVIILADDLGFDDVSFRGSNHFLTPNIDALAYNGVVLKNLYTPAMCTPSRAALLTGKYPINTGMQHYVIPNDQPWGLPTNETTMAQIFQEHGYFTSLIGKWHLGMSRKAYTPTMRGFSQHYGYLGSYIDYYDHTLYSPSKTYSRGHDFRDNLDVTHKRAGAYVTHVLTEAAVQLIATHNVKEQPLFLLLSHLAPHSGNEDKPLQATAEEMEKFAYINDTTKRTYAAMVSLLDQSVGQIIDALSAKNILNNTIILFLSDNGGPSLGMHSTTASNYPLRGQKDSPWEGAMRSSAAIWSAQFEKLGTVWKQQIYIADILPTLAAAAGIDLSMLHSKLDGLNLWSALKYGYESVEREIVHNIDDISNYVSYMKGKWKFINGTTSRGIYDGWYGARLNSTDIDPRSLQYEQVVRNTTVWHHLNNFNHHNSTLNVTNQRSLSAVKCQYVEGIACQPLLTPCLFDIESDPCEQNNLYEKYQNSKMLQNLLARLEDFRQHARPPNNKPTDINCDPKYYHNEWTWWEDIRNAGTQTSLQHFSILLINILALLLISF